MVLLTFNDGVKVSPLRELFIVLIKHFTILNVLRFSFYYEKYKQVRADIESRLRTHSSRQSLHFKFHKVKNEEMVEIYNIER